MLASVGRVGRLGNAALRRGVPFDLDAFMATQADGLYFDTTKMDRFFQSPEVSAVLADDAGEPIGLALDQRTWGGKSLSQLVALQSELVTDNEFNIGTGWSNFGDGGTIAGGILTIVLTGGYSGLSRSLNTEAGKTYRVSARARRVSGSATAIIALRTGNNGGGTALGSASTSSTEWAIVEFYFRETATTTRYIAAGAGTAAGTVEYDSVSVKEVPGKHGIQATGTLKPTRQTTGAKFDGSDDNWLTNYTAGSGAIFMVALVEVPASLSITQVVAGTNAISSNFYAAFTTAGLFRTGVGNVLTTVGALDRRGQQVVFGLTASTGANGNRRSFEDTALVENTTFTGSINTTIPLRVGALNANGTASNFFGGSIKKLIVGSEFLDLSTYLKIRNALLAA